MFSYYGGKQRIIKHYPSPVHDTIIEPFAGSARYALRYFEKEVILIEKYKKVYDIWEYLLQCSVDDIRRLPLLKQGQEVKREDYDCDGAYNLMRFLIVQGAFSGNNFVSKWGAGRLQTNINNVARNLYKIKHWKIIQGSYRDHANVRATWFIDPPYFKGGHKYPMSNKKIDYNDVRAYAMERKGQVIVCENSSATWMEFIPLINTYGVKKTTEEVIWLNTRMSDPGKQQALFQ